MRSSPFARVPRQTILCRRVHLHPCLGHCGNVLRDVASGKSCENRAHSSACCRHSLEVIVVPHALRNAVNKNAFVRLGFPGLRPAPFVVMRGEALPGARSSIRTEERLGVGVCREPPQKTVGGSRF